MVNEVLYNSFWIVGPFDDGTYDVNDITNELDDGNFESLEAAQKYIEEKYSED